MKPGGNISHAFKRPIVVAILIGVAVALAALVASAVIGMRISSEVREVMKMQTLASLVGDGLEEQLRQTGKYPTRLDKLTFTDESAISTLGFSRSDLQKFGYSSDGTKFKLNFQSTHFRFGLSGDKTSGLTMEPMTGRNDRAHHDCD